MSANSAQKTPVSATLNQFAQQKIITEISKNGLAMPGTVQSVSGSIVTVKMDINTTAPNGGTNIPEITMPVFGPEYIRYPIQVGDRGVTFPVDFYIGGVSGLGPNVPAELNQQGNLSCLVWFPIGSKKFSASPDPNATVIYGPNGVILQDTAGASIATISGGGVELDTAGVDATENLSVGNGASGVFGTPTGQVVTVVAGIIVNIA